MCVDAGTIHDGQPIDMFVYDHKKIRNLKCSIDADDDDADAAATAAASAAEHEASATLL